MMSSIYPRGSSNSPHFSRNNYHSSTSNRNRGTSKFQSSSSSPTLGTRRTVNFKPDFIQFHGNLNHQYFLKFKNKYPDIGVIIGKNIINKNDLEDLKIFDDIADYFLLDGAKSGSGQSFDWSIISNFNFTKPWFLAGGLTLDNINEAIKITKASMIDISSGLEKTRFIKDKDLIMALMKKLNKVC